MMRRTEGTRTRPLGLLSSVFLFAALLLPGCRPIALPPPTSRPVAAAQLAGIWKYDADYGKISVSLALGTNGTFVQTVVFPDKTREPLVHRGTWALDGSRPVMRLLRPVAFSREYEPWVEEDVNWWVMDTYDSGRPFALFGSAYNGDPDNFSNLICVSPRPPVPKKKRSFLHRLSHLF